MFHIINRSLFFVNPCFSMSNASQPLMLPINSSSHSSSLGDITSITKNLNLNLSLGGGKSSAEGDEFKAAIAAFQRKLNESRTGDLTIKDADHFSADQIVLAAAKTETIRKLGGGTYQYFQVTTSIPQPSGSPLTLDNFEYNFHLNQPITIGEQVIPAGPIVVEAPRGCYLSRPKTAPADAPLEPFIWIKLDRTKPAESRIIDDMLAVQDQIKLYIKYHTGCIEGNKPSNPQSLIGISNISAQYVEMMFQPFIQPGKTDGKIDPYSNIYSLYLRINRSAKHQSQFKDSGGRSLPFEALSNGKPLWVIPQIKISRVVVAAGKFYVKPELSSMIVIDSEESEDKQAGTLLFLQKDADKLAEYRNGFNRVSKLMTDTANAPPPVVGNPVASAGVPSRSHDSLSSSSLPSTLPPLNLNR